MVSRSQQSDTNPDVKKVFNLFVAAEGQLNAMLARRSTLARPLAVEHHITVCLTDPALYTETASVWNAADKLSAFTQFPDKILGTIGQATDYVPPIECFAAQRLHFPYAHT